MRCLAFLATVISFASPVGAETLVLRPAQVFDGVDPKPHPGWSVLVEGDRKSVV